MKVLLLLIVGMVLLSGCDPYEKDGIIYEHVIDQEMPDLPAETVQPDDYTDIQTAEDDFEALDETLDGLE